ncbi:flavodoxin domain-containing protein [Fredinandcohnia humi]
MKVGIVYTSVTGNTEETVNNIYSIAKKYTKDSSIFPVARFPLHELMTFDVIIIGTYTWGNGDIPLEMMSLYRAFEEYDTKEIITGVVGTGDQCYPRFCGAVDEFRDMLYVHSNLAATLKIELTPQLLDIERCQQFVKIIMERAKSKTRV